jgi:protein-S-isoprenylcysteine O-methyltransferase
MNFKPIGDVVMILWFLLEFIRAGNKASRNFSPGRTPGSGRIFCLLFLVFVISWVVRRAGFGNYDLPVLLGWIGITVMLIGIVFRQYAIIVLGRYFSGVIHIEEGQQLVTKGPYRYIRHPTYTGMLLGFDGAGIASGNWVITTAFIVLPTIAILRRIKAEEQLLTSHFGDEYRDYISKTKKLIPFVF